MIVAVQDGIFSSRQPNLTWRGGRIVAKITEVVSATKRLKTLSEALIVSRIDEALSEDGPYTLFAPTEEAFSEIGVDTLVALAADREDLAHTLRSHVVAGKYLLHDLANMDRLHSIAGTELFVSIGEDCEAYVEEARIVLGDVHAENGVVHLIDLVILPLAEDEAAADGAQGVHAGDVLGIAPYSDVSSVFDYGTGVGEDDEDDSVAV
jgi:uncharacterized surface protein with fasciclin (FAS1) repeats